MFYPLDFPKTHILATERVWLGINPYTVFPLSAWPAYVYPPASLFLFSAIRSITPQAIAQLILLVACVGYGLSVARGPAGRVAAWTGVEP